MAMTQLADIIQRTAFQKKALLESLYNSVLFGSGIIVPDSELTAHASANLGRTFEFDYFTDLADTLANVSSDNPASDATPGKIGTGQMKAAKLMRNQGWGSANLVASLSHLGDPMNAIASRIGAYWGRQYDFAAISIYKGVIADNIASNSGDMINDISAVSNGQKITFDALVDTAQTLGDAQGQLQVAVMHSSQIAVLTKDQVTNKVFDSNGKLLYVELLGWRLIVNDSVPNAAGVYDTIIFKNGAIGFGQGKPKKQEEMSNSAEAGDGEGTETVWSRRHFVIHPYGFTYTGTPAGKSDTNAELELAATWSRVHERKRIGLAVLRSKNANSV